MTNSDEDAGDVTGIMKWIKVVVVGGGFIDNIVTLKLWLGTETSHSLAAIRETTNITFIYKVVSVSVFNLS